MKKFLTAALVAAPLLVLGACGESQNDRLAEVLETEGALAPKEAECVADFLIDSDVKDETIEAIITNDQDYEPTDAETTKAIEALGKSFTECEVELVSPDPEGEPGDETDAPSPDATPTSSPEDDQ